MEFARPGFAQFMSGTCGRLLRIVVSAAIIAAGILWVGGALGWTLAIVGLVAVVAGTLDFCLLGCYSAHLSRAATFPSHRAASLRSYGRWHKMVTDG